MTEPQLEQRTIETTHQDGITRITLQRPPVNVLNIAMMRELDDALKCDALTEDARVVVLQAQGKAFSAGVDVADHTPERTEEMLTIFHSVISRVKACPVPTVALVERAALGGGAELATSCDLVLAGEKAKFGQPEILLGVFPPVAMVNLPGSVGVRKAAQLIFTGETISAEEAERIGLVNAVFPAETFAEQADVFLQRFSTMSRASLIETKAAFREALTVTDPERALQVVEERYLERLMETHDAREGIAAFLEKRPPVWQHR
ncbi:MAG: enoyl-CoA hydratase/isomerase family protein [Rhodothermales bacterium]